MTTTAPWMQARRLLDSVVERLGAERLSQDESALLSASHWAAGQDVRLRDDVRFRPTPWGRWILAGNYLANDSLVERLRHEPVSTLELDAALDALESAVGRRCVACAADGRLVMAQGQVRLSARELTDEPLIEPDIPPLARYTTHLPVHSLKAAAASEPAGEWGPRAQDEVIETLGWVRVELSGRGLNERMFVARIEGRSMDDGRSGLVDGAFAVFELWPAGTRQNLNVLVRGAFSDPETGSYALKKYVADARDAEGRHANISLVSLNPDKARYPDIRLEPREDDDLAVVAKVVQPLSLDEIARRPRPLTRRGRRDLGSPQAREELGAALAAQVERFFEAERRPNDEPDLETWRAEVVCLDVASGGLHLEVGPLAGLWSFVRTLRVKGESWEARVSAFNARERAVRVPAPPGSGPWRWLAEGFEDDSDVDFSMLALDAPAEDRVQVFRVDAEGTGRLMESGMLAPGQHYRLLLPPELAKELASDTLEPCGGGWRLWELGMPNPVPAALAVSLGELGLRIGEVQPQLRWVIEGPASWRTNRRGESFACFTPDCAPVVELQGARCELEGEAAVFMQGPEGLTTLVLPAGDRQLLRLDGLACGRYALQFTHCRTAIPVQHLMFEVIPKAPLPPPAAARLLVGEQAQAARPGSSAGTEEQDLVTLTHLAIEVPPGWPVRASWKEYSEDLIWRGSFDEQGVHDARDLLDKVHARAARRPVGDLAIDFAELGRVVLPHASHPEAQAVRERLAELVSTRGGGVARLAGQFMRLLPLWFEPVCAALGYDLERFEDEVPEAPEHAMALRLFHVERAGNRIERRMVRLLVLMEALPEQLAPEMLAWMDAVCERERLREVLLSDGAIWAVRRKGSRLPLRHWVLAETVAEPDDCLAFLQDVAEGV